MRGFVDKARDWFQVSYERRTNGGAIFMGVAAVAFAGAMIWIFTQ